MSQKPADVFLSVVDLFALLVPGGLATLTLGPVLFKLPFKGISNTLGGEEPLRGLDWAIFLFAAYVAGTFLQSVSSQVLNPIFRRFYLHSKLSQYSRLRERVETHVAAHLGREGDPLNWAEAAVRLKDTSVGTWIDRYDAVSKLFRALTVLFIAIAIQQLWHGAWQNSAVLLFFGGLALWRFFHQKWKNRQYVYRCYSLLFLDSSDAVLPAGTPGAPDP